MHLVRDVTGMGVRAQEEVRSFSADTWSIFTTSENLTLLGQSLAAERVASDWYRNITNGVNRTSAIAVSTDPHISMRPTSSPIWFNHGHG